MIIGIAAALALGLVLQETDTTFDVRAGSRLVLDMHDGAAVVGVWDRPQIRVQANRRQRDIDIRQSPAGVRIDAEGDHDVMRGIRFAITVPREFGVAIDGVNVAATIDGVRGNVDIDNVEGDITIRNVVGDVALESVSGSVTVDNLRGNLSAESTNQGFLITGVRGSIEAETANGNIVMRAVDASNVEANTINGIIEFDGAVRDDGRYYLGAFNGRITMSIQERANASITVRTTNGTIVTAFPVPLQSTHENRISFTVGTGSARVELESYNGTIHLVRPRGR